MRATCERTIREVRQASRFGLNDPGHACIGGEIDSTYISTTDAEYGDLMGEYGDGQTFNLYDAQGCTNAMLDGAGTVTARFKHQAFGQAQSADVSIIDGNRGNASASSAARR